MTRSSTLNPVDADAAREVVRSGAVRHIGIIMDGNRRWAKNQGAPGPQGHLEGFKALKNLIRYCGTELHLPILTVYAFSTENWRRTPMEVELLMNLFQHAIQTEVEELMRQNGRIRFIGDVSGLSKSFQKLCKEAEARTANNTGLLFQVAFNYGGRAEVVASCKKIAEAVQSGSLAVDAISEETIQAHLYTGDQPDPDMIIRTGNESRLSNFLLWQAAYSELFIVPELWPEFSPEVLNRTILEFQSRQRRFGQ
jgi:undecaprenyl diphosphate synthase